MKKKLSTIFVLAMSAGTIFSQTWIDKMQDPTVNFYEVQRTFNKENQKAEKEMQRERYEAFQKEQEQLKKASGHIIKDQPKPSAEKKIPGWKMYKRWESDMESRLYPSGDRSVMINAWSEYLDNFYATAGARAPSPAAANWSLIGPTTTVPTNGGAGRLAFVKFHPGVPTTIYVGSPIGGLWKSTNSGVTWSTNTDNLPTIGCTDMAIHPTNPLIQYLAMGDGDGGDLSSIGILKTTNGGTTWNPTGLTWTVINGRKISRLLMNPQNPNSLLAATSNGVYRTHNAGATWTQISTALANMKDMEYKPNDTSTIYVASTTQFYKSTNGGTSFTVISSGLPASTEVRRYAIGVSAANPAYVYLLAAGTDSGLEGIYRSTNSGASFTTRSTSPNYLGHNADGSSVGGQGSYDLCIAVSPLNADQVVIGGINVWRSTDGGSNWTLNAHWYGGGAPYAHADVHALEYLPGSGSTYFSGNDGGLFKTTNNGVSWTDLSNGLHISTAYRIGLSKTNANLLLTGWQDNGTARWSGGSSWSRPIGGDGMECAINWSNENIQYGELYYGNIRRTTTGGTFSNIVASGGTGVDSDGDWVTPYLIAPSNASTLFVGKDQVYKSTNTGTSWSQVGSISGGTGKLIALANAASNINYIYAAKRNKFYTSTDGVTFTDRTAGLPVASAAITYITVHPTNPSRVWVTFSGYSAANKVWYSSNAGTTWSNYSTGLPNLPTNCIVYQNNAASFDPLYVGMDVGVYYRDNTMSSWVLYNTGLPNVGVMELEIHYTALKLRAATFGRSIWQSNLNTPGGAVAPPVSDFIANKTNICVGQCINYTDLSAGSATSWSWSFSGGTPATSSLQNPTNICYNTPGIYTATMVATNAGGSNTMTKTGYIVVSAPIALPLSEGFQGTTFVPSAWSLSNPDADVTWVQNTTAGGYAASTKCASLDNLTPATTTAGKTDDLLTPKYNFTSVSTASLSFDVAYCRYDATYFDSLIVYVSTNCGTTWSRIYSKGGTALATAPDQTVIFAPTSTQWRTETVSMTPYAGQANVMLKFQNKSGWGQILYLDNINISTAVASVGITQTGGTNPMCAGSSATFTATATNGGSTPTYQWQVNGANVGVNSPTYTTTALTNGDIIKCIMTSSLGSVAGSPATSATITMMVNAIPAAPTAGSNSPVCEGTMLNLTSNTISGASYSWSGPGSYASSSEDPNRPSATAGMAGTYSVTATVAGCTSLMGTTTVVVNPSVTPSVVIAASPGGPICSGNPVLFTATLSNGGSSPGYQWQVNGTNAGTGATFTSSALNNGDAISCSLTSNATCASPVTASSNIITMTVDPTPAIPVITQSGAVLTSSASAGNQWYLDGVLIPGANGQTYTITVNGTYTVMVTNGPCSSLSTPLVFTTMGIADVQNVNQLSIFPNPNDGNFTISFTATEETSYTLELTNALGQLIYREELIQYSGTYSKSFSVLSYGRGIYTISLSNDKNEAVRKIIVY